MAVQQLRRESGIVNSKASRASFSSLASSRSASQRQTSRPFSSLSSASLKLAYRI
ncbi:hypothetical protein Plhal304r1_c071g0159791 [Plasmopara halstedii]